MQVIHEIDEYRHILIFIQYIYKYSFVKQLRFKENAIKIVDLKSS